MEGTVQISVNDFTKLLDFKRRALDAEQKIAVIQNRLAEKVEKTIEKGSCFVSVELSDFAPVIDTKAVEEQIWEEYWKTQGGKKNG